MSVLQAKTTSADLVPLADRLRYMRLFRAATVLAAALFGAFLSADVTAGLPALAAATGGYVVGSLATEAFWRLWRRRGITLFGGMLIADGFYLAWLSYATGGSASPLRYLIVVHVVAVSLLASYRTGLKLALWHSLLAYGVYHLEQAGLVAPAAADAVSGATRFELLAFAAVLWVVAIVTASFSAVNERELRRRRFDLEALAALATKLEGAKDPRDRGGVFVDHVVDTFGFERAALVGMHDGGYRLTAARQCRATETQPGAGPGSVLRHVAETGSTLLVSQFDPRSDAWLVELFAGAGNFAVVPLAAEGGPVAVLVVEHGLRKGSRVERRVVGMVERFASHAALSFSNASLIEQLRKTAATDGLTSIANRRSFDDSLRRELSRAQRSGGQLSVILLDIDRFKLLNDTHGHQTGDDVLRHVARLVARSCRDFDTPARYGGEEFAVVLPGCAPVDAARIAERLRESLMSADGPAPVTASFGVASFPAHAVDEASLVSAADAALYESKREGRNRVTVSVRRRLAPIDATAAS